MSQFGSIKPTSITLTTTPQKLFTTPKSGREGYRGVVASSGGGSVYIKDVTDGSTPTFTDMVTNELVSIPIVNPGESFESGAKDTVVAWGCTDAGTSPVALEELGS